VDLLTVACFESYKGRQPALHVVDGYGGLKGYNLDIVDTTTGPIRERIYKIIKASMHSSSLWLPQLIDKLIYSMEDMCMSTFFRELDAQYFRMSPETGLRAQRDFQGLVYLPDFTIHSFLLIFAAFSAEWCFFKQFLENDGKSVGLPARD
jgi:hypothetical protein